MAMFNPNNASFTGGTYVAAQGDFHTHTYNINEGRKGMDLLSSSIAPGAFHNSSERYDPPKCHPATRVAVLQHIMAWINDLQKVLFFMWLYGPAGAGKSAIAQSIAELCHDANILAASFFFSRTAVGRNDESRLISTLVYQLCVSIPAIRKYVEDTIERDPLVLSRSLEAQIRSLMVDPLRRALLDDKDAMSLHSGPKVIIIDGLDECGTAKVQRYILSALATAIQEIPLPISFLVASRPEQIIRDAFNVEPLCPITRPLALDDSYDPDKDIKLFLQLKFHEIRQKHPLRNLLPPEWPSESEIIRLVEKSSGQFIYAATAMKYLDSPHHRPTDALDIIFGLSNPGVDTPFAELDALYIHIFSQVKDINRALEIISLLLLNTVINKPLTPQLVENIFFLRPGDVYIILSDLHSIMDVPAPATDKNLREIRIYHASLGDFLFDESRSAKFYIDRRNAHTNLTRYFLKHISKTDLSTEGTDSYSAEAFTMHCPQSSPTPELLDGIYEFDFRHFLANSNFGKTMVHLPIHQVFHWLEVHSQDHYSQHLLSLDEHLKFELGLLMTHSNESTLIQATQLLVTAVMLPDFNNVYVDSISKILVIDIHPDSSDACSRAFLRIKYISRQTRRLLSEFLGDPTRSKEFYVDGNKFAALATQFTKILFGPSVYVLPLSLTGLF
ncbi:hypothetical protein BYT27DRAFT_7197492 [Phlegmacium glaucopus]|nr:hypothetical protein BYT27DRAFT_7197492 [Phlegmacium glaucopus]